MVVVRFAKSHSIGIVNADSRRSLNGSAFRLPSGRGFGLGRYGSVPRRMALRIVNVQVGEVLDRIPRLLALELVVRKISLAMDT